jgi:hypothetical protein
MGIRDDKPTITTRSYKVGQHADGTTNVIAFPINKPTIKRTAIEGQLDNIQKFLRYQFKCIKEQMEELSNMQRECAKTEDSYDELLVEYAARVGVTNVNKRYMDYSKRVEPVITDDGMELRFKDDE